jgi:hypothetical protein
MQPKGTNVQTELLKPEKIAEEINALAYDAGWCYDLSST